MGPQHTHIVRLLAAAFIITSITAESDAGECVEEIGGSRAERRRMFRRLPWCGYMAFDIGDRTGVGIIARTSAKNV
jgi:hypothetical protein